MPMNITQKIIHSHLVEGEMIAGKEIAMKIDQTLCQDATGTLVMLELEAMGLDRVKTELSVQYVDHNLIQEDFKNADDHLFLQSAAQRYGVWFSRAGNGVSHPLHMEFFGKPGKTLVGSDSHTCAGGAIGMLAIGTGGLEVAMSMAGYPFFVKMPKVMGIELTGKMPEWVSAKDIILEMLRRHGVKGGVGYVIEYYGNGLKHLDLWDRHVIANMGAELGATGTIFPSDKKTLEFLKMHGRESDWLELSSDKNANYDKNDVINLSELEPLIALPSSPGNVKLVREVKGRDIYQSYIGSSGNPGYRDLAISALMVSGRQINPNVSFDINPATRNILEELAENGLLANLIHAGARIHQAGCNGCIGMGQAPATGRNSLRTVPRNFPGRSGSREDSVYLCSPEVATASALKGIITDPRDLDFPCPKVRKPKKIIVNRNMMQSPLSPFESVRIKLVKGPNISSIPELKPISKDVKLAVLLKMNDNVSTDEILPAGARVLPYRSNIPRISDFAFDMIDETYSRRAKELKEKNEHHAVIGGDNYGQGSSREHAALAPAYLGLQLVIAKSYARIHWQNLINFGILPLTFVNFDDYRKIEQGDFIVIKNIFDSIKSGDILKANIDGKSFEITLRHNLSRRQIDVLESGGLINWVKKHG
ncbi:2,3-dimethylmalate dehydratase large subunit [Aquicella siphonis]|uniref:2,3-dimethylmalate dehydratase large subunit n=1 Tax=Aquicella siphonis TaxID=254247 RepID=A0A5E4PFJ0_9COXI|nr:aconitate hydratase [Aquicella siphonis]VVC75385.1 2,3-dimethylmalate dehydratase large subunit [Aquicella siphonis]